MKKLKQKKSILFIITNLDAGGAEKALIDLLKTFDYQKYEVSLCMLYEEGDYLSEIPADVDVTILFSKKKSLFRKSFRYYSKYGNSWLFSCLIRLKLKMHYDVIVSFLEGYPLLFHELIADRAEKNITWVHCDLLQNHYTLLDGFYSELRERRAYNKMDTIVFVSKNSLTNFKKIYNIPPVMKSIYNIIDVEAIRSKVDVQLVKSDRFVIVAVGRLVSLKGFDKLIRVVKKLKDNEYSLYLHLIGQGEEYQHLLSLRNELGLQKEVSFLGFKENPYCYMQSADLFVSSSLSEGLSLVICEAFALSIPVLATKTAGSLELLNEGEYGVLTEHDEQSIYAGIKLLIDDSVLLSYYKTKSELRSQIFNVDNTLSEIESLF